MIEDGVEIISTGIILSPKECEEVTIDIEYTSTGTITHNEWVLEGIIPNGLEFLSDGNNPRIVGRTKMFIDQSIIPAYEFYPKEELKMDGSNRKNNGDLIASSFSFDFIIKHKYILKDILTGIDEEKEVVSGVLSIVMNHLENKENTIFMKSYLNNDSLEEYNILTLNNGVVNVTAQVKPREIPYDGRVYRKNDTEDLLRNHPGPFSICQGD